MGRKLDALLGRNFRACKLKVVTNLAVSRITILRKQRQARYSQARSDVVDILKLQQHERALIRVEFVVKDRNMLDALDMMENYCRFLIERVMLLEKNKLGLKLACLFNEFTFADFPHVPTGCAEFPELQEIRGIFQLRFGKEFIARAIELRNNCGVNPKKLSARQTTLESSIELLRSIASEVHLTLDLKLHDHLPHAVEIMRKDIADNHQMKQESSIPDEELSSEPLRARNKYTDVAAAAQEAFESAAYAVTAARAAIELSRSRSHHYYQDDHDTSSSESESDEKSTKLDSATNGKVAESPTIMDKQIVLYEAYEEEEVENNQQLHGNIPAVLEHHNLDQESGETLNWDVLKVSSDIHSSNLEKQLHVPLSRRVRKNSH
ncbi:unnamed protein product [Linum tenue]|uniref:IST1-like protein n=1 Tax=Linum tenue TaxID=586396 RepID=A0AAV0MYB6_9ROSI|nr:unnamed protein product [Linum tenue]